jgi:ribokinase
MSKPICILISYVTELIFDVDELPRLGETLHGHFSVGHGGKGMNMAVCAQRLGASPQILGRVGTDSFSTHAMAFLADEGLKLDSLQRDDTGGSAGAVFRLKNGSNAIVLDTGANGRLTPKDLEPHHDLLRNSSFVLSPLEIPVATVEHAFRIAKSGGATTILNPAPIPDDGLPDSLLDVCDIVTPNFHEASSLGPLLSESNESILVCATHASQRGTTRRDIIITVGDRGAFVYQRVGTHRWCRPPKANIVDTTGAGDAFNGGLITALARGASLFEAAEFGVRVATTKCTRQGTARAMPRKEELV